MPKTASLGIDIEAREGGHGLSLTERGCFAGARLGVPAGPVSMIDPCSFPLGQGVTVTETAA